MHFDFPLRGVDGFTPGRFAWSPVCAVLAAAGTQKVPGSAHGCLHVFTEDGELVEDASVQRVARVSSLAWHPTQPLLAVGFESGEMLAWNHATKQMHECKKLHVAPVTFLEFSRHGGNVVSGDEDGQVGVWKFGSGGKPSLVQAFKLGQPLDFCRAFGSDDAGKNAAAGGDAVLLGLPFQFFVATAGGQVYKCDQNGNADVVCVPLPSLAVPWRPSLTGPRRRPAASRRRASCWRSCLTPTRRRWPPSRAPCS